MGDSRSNRWVAGFDETCDESRLIRGSISTLEFVSILDYNGLGDEMEHFPEVGLHTSSVNKNSSAGQQPTDAARLDFQGGEVSMSTLQMRASSSDMMKEWHKAGMARMSLDCTVGAYRKGGG